MNFIVSKIRKVRPLVSDFCKRADMLLFALCMVCSVFGLILISSATKSYGTSSYMRTQIIAMFIGIFLYVLFTIIDIEILADKWAMLYLFGVIFICLLFPFGVSESGNSGWLRFFGFGIQPTEVVKIVFIVTFSKHVSLLKQRGTLNKPLSVVSLLLHFGFLFGLIIVASSDLGSALIFMFAFLVILFTGGLRFYWFLIGAALAALATPFLWSNFFSDIQRQRILAPYDSSIDPKGYGINWQTNQGKIAMANGGLTGSGLYKGSQTQSQNVSGKHTDFIFTVAGEELGMIACIAIILLLLLLMARCIYVGIKSNNTMHMLICFGIASTVFFQSFENIGMCIGLTPVIGITLPFFSYGGSSMFTSFAAMGLISGIHYRPKPQRFRSM